MVDIILIILTLLITIIFYIKGFSSVSMKAIKIVLSYSLFSFIMPYTHNSLFINNFKEHIAKATYRIIPKISQSAAKNISNVLFLISAFILCFIFVGIIVALLSKVLTKLQHKSVTIKSLDKLLGACVGLAFSLLVLSLFVLISSNYIPMLDLVSQSKLLSSTLISNLTSVMESYFNSIIR